MIEIALKNYSDIPAPLKKRGAKRKIDKACKKANGNIYDGYYYAHDIVRDKLRAFSVHRNKLLPGDKPKCYYCESYSEHVAVLQVEHFRPKAKVDIVDTNGVANAGYYWLGLEWSNLLLSCPSCNNKVAKGNRFPLVKYQNRALPFNPISIGPPLSYNSTNCRARSSYLTLEEPLLINPELEDPTPYLTFDSMGQIYGVGKKGKTSVEIYNLDRDSLLAARQELITPILSDVNLAIAANKLGRCVGDAFIAWLEAICNKVLEYDNIRREYCLWGRYIIQNFEDCIVLKIEEEFREDLRTAFGNLRILANP